MPAVRHVFGDVVLDTDRYELRRAGEPVHVEPQVFDVLALLLANRHRVVPKTELLDTVWGDRFVGESALTSRIKAARQAVGDDGSAQKVIRTVHGRGYRFVADVQVADGEPRSRPEDGAPPPEQVIRFCTTSDGVRLAYATVGHGPPLVRAAHWITHLDYDWHSPVWRHWLEGLADGRTLVRYDERGCGLSDHDIGEWSIDAFVHDLETVVDELGLGRFPLLGVSQGGPVAIAYADRHPERVSRLVLIGSYAQGRAGVLAPRRSVARPTSRSRSPVSAGAGTTRRSAASSRRRSSPTAPPSSGTPSPSCCAARRRPRTRPSSWRRGPRST